MSSIEQQRSFWNAWNAEWRSADLDEFMQRQRDVAVDSAGRFDRNDLRILDVGCGTGWLGASLLRFGRVTGTDLSPGAIADGQARYPRVDLRVGRAFRPRGFGRLHCSRRRPAGVPPAVCRSPSSGGVAGPHDAEPAHLEPQVGTQAGRRRAASRLASARTYPEHVARAISRGARRLDRARRRSRCVVLGREPVAARWDAAARRAKTMGRFARTGHARPRARRRRAQVREDDLGRLLRPW